MKPDQYAECHLLLAVMNGDTDEANALLEQMSLPERQALMESVRRIRGALIDGRFARDPGDPALPRAFHGETVG